MNRFLTLAATVTLLASVATAGEPRISLSEDLFNFGEVWYGAVLNHEVKIRNDGDETLKISKVRASCGCTAGQARKTELAPGEETVAVVTFDSKRKQGQVATTVTIFSNDPKQPQATFNLRGFVKRALELDPIGGCVMRSMDGTTPMTGKAIIRSKVDEPMKLELVRMATDKFDVRIEEVEPGKVFHVYGTSRPPFPVGRTTGMAIFKTGLEREPELQLPLSANVVETVELSPKAVYIDRDMIKESTTRTVNLLYFGERTDFSVTGVESPSPLVEATVGATVPAPDYYARLDPPPTLMGTIRLKLPPGAEIPDAGVPLIVTTNEKGFERVELLVTNNAAQFHERMQTQRK